MAEALVFLIGAPTVAAVVWLGLCAITNGRPYWPERRP